MAFDGHYEIAQIWKLDTSPLFKGRYFQLSSYLAEYLMPVLLPGRFKLWAEKYGRIACMAPFDHVGIHLQGDEDVPPQLSNEAYLICRAVRTDGPLQVRIRYDGTVEQYLAQREEVFGTAVPYSIYIEDGLSAEEVEQFEVYDGHYNRAWPLIRGGWRTPHPKLRDLFENRKDFLRNWDLRNMRDLEIFEDVDHIRRYYVDGELDAEVASIGVPEDPNSDTDVPPDGDGVADFEED
jgi:hypothetical protein